MWGWDGASILVDKGALIWPWSEGAMWWPLCRSEAFTQREGGGGGERKREKGKRRVGQRGKGKGKGKVAPPSMCVICVREKKRCDEREKCVWAWRRKMLYEKRLSFLKKKKRISSLFVTNHRMSVCYKIYCYVTVC